MFDDEKLANDLKQIAAQISAIAGKAPEDRSEAWAAIHDRLVMIEVDLIHSSANPNWQRHAHQLFDLRHAVRALCSPGESAGEAPGDLAARALDIIRKVLGEDDVNAPSGNS